MNKTLIADHHPILRQGLRTLLEKNENFEIVGSINDGNDLLNFLSKNPVDLLILEIDIPHLNSITSIKVIKREFPNVKILILSMHAEEVYALSAIKYGASGYVSKTAELDRLMEAIEYVVKGGIYLNEELSKRILDQNNNRNVLAMRYKQLSAREMEVLNLIAKGNRNKEIALALDINEKTVSTYKMRLLKKLDANNVAELIQHTRLLQEDTI